jgi:uncharacterized membrane protein YoaK (UPF0700 family)
MILLLAVAGGSVDAAMLLGFGVLTAAQTGNTVLLAVAIARHQIAVGLGSAVSVLGYVVGAMAGELVILDPGTAPVSPAVRRALLIELVPLGSLLVAWHMAGIQPGQDTAMLLVALAALAMGLQSAAVLRLHAGPTTTYVTGTLTTFAIRAIQWLHRCDTGQQSVPKREDADAARSLSGMLFYGVTWGMYLAGAVIGALLYLRAGEPALILPILAVALAVALAGSQRAEAGSDYAN